MGKEVQLSMVAQIMIKRCCYCYLVIAFISCLINVMISYRDYYEFLRPVHFSLYSFYEIVLTASVSSLFPNYKEYDIIKHMSIHLAQSKFKENRSSKVGKAKDGERAMEIVSRCEASTAAIELEASPLRFSL